MAGFLKNALVVTFLTLGVSNISHAEEVDDYINQPESAASTSELNRLINDSLSNFIKKANEEGDLADCSLKEIKQSAIDYLGKGFTEIGNNLRDKPKEYKINYAGGANGSNNSVIYKDVEIRGCCTTSVNVNGIVIGVDKIDHFFGNGAMLYEETLSDPSIGDKELLAMNAGQEHGTLGLAGSGVKSYGDMSANWSGIGFYRNLVDGDHPLITCKKGVLSLTRPFKIEDYVNVGWNEATNCSAFANKKNAAVFAKNLESAHLKCPQVEASCKKLIAMYQSDPLAQKTLVSPVCLKGLPMNESVEESSGITWDKLKRALGGVRLKEVFKFIDSDGPVPQPRGAVQ